MGAVPPSRLAEEEEERMPAKKKMKTTKTVIATRSVSTLDLTKPLKVSASATPRSKSDCSGSAEFGPRPFVN